MAITNIIINIMISISKYIIPFHGIDGFGG